MRALPKRYVTEYCDDIIPQIVVDEDVVAKRQAYMRGSTDGRSNKALVKEVLRIAQLHNAPLQVHAIAQGVWCMNHTRDPAVAPLVAGVRPEDRKLQAYAVGAQLCSDGQHIVPRAVVASAALEDLTSESRALLTNIMRRLGRVTADWLDLNAAIDASQRFGVNSDEEEESEEDASDEDNEEEEESEGGSDKDESEEEGSDKDESDEGSDKDDSEAFEASEPSDSESEDLDDMDCDEIEALRNMDVPGTPVSDWIVDSDGAIVLD